MSLFRSQVIGISKSLSVTSVFWIEKFHLKDAHGLANERTRTAFPLLTLPDASACHRMPKREQRLL